MSAQAIEHAQRIVVGIDGSPGSKTALRWAITQAGLTRAMVEALSAWQDPATIGSAYGWSTVMFEGDSMP